MESVTMHSLLISSFAVIVYAYNDTINTTDVEIPARHISLKDSKRNDNSIEMSIDGVDFHSNSLNYAVRYRKCQSSYSYQLVSSSIFSVSNLDFETCYEFSVTGMNMSGGCVEEGWNKVFKFETGPTASIQCPTSFVQLEKMPGSCFLFSSVKATKEDAKYKCQQYGAHLMTLETKEKKEAITRHIKNFMDSRTEWWTDGIAKVVNGSRQFLWESTGSTLNYTDWYQGQPNGGNEFCLTMLPMVTYDFKLGDTSCTNLFGFVCQI